MDDMNIKAQRNNDKLFLLEYEQLRKAVTCPICISGYTLPVALSCGHAFCKDCINAALAVREICPLCSMAANRRKLQESSGSIHELFTLLSSFVFALEPVNYNTGPTIAASNSNIENDRVVVSEDVSPVVQSDSLPLLTTSDVVLETVVDPVILKPGVLVNVLPRTWAGINKLGGIGWITSAHYNEGSFVPCEYDVKYVLDSTTDYKIPAAFVEPHKELDRTSRRSRTTGASPGPGSAPNSSSKSVKTTPNSSGKSTSAKKRKAATLSPSTSSDPPLPMVVLTTFVATSTIEKLNELSAKMPHVSVATQFGPKVTHVIVSVDRYGVLKRRTMKYMQAILGGLWILSSSWVDACYTKMTMLSELPYEVKKNSKAQLDNAPQRARVHMNKLKQRATQQATVNSKNATEAVLASSVSHCVNSDLFSPCRVLLLGQFPTPGPPRSDTEDLLKRGGADVTCNLSTFLQWVEAIESSDSGNNGKEKSNRYLVIVCGDNNSKEVFTALPPNVAKRVNCVDRGDKCDASRGISAVGPVWVFDSITNYDLLPPSMFQI